MFDISLFTFEKRKNSTKQPDMADASTFSGEIKEDFTPMAPQVTFDFPDPTNIPPYNYAYIQKFSRYYWITDWLYIGGLWRATMAVDVLATYKEQIIRSNQFVARAAAIKNGYIVDASYAPTATVLREERKIDMYNLWGITSESDGTIIAGIVNNSGKNIGAVTYYAMEYSTFRDLMYRMLSDIAWMNISTAEISEELQKALINPVQYVVSCIWLPINYDFFPDTPQGYVNLGWWRFPLGNTCKILSRPLKDVDTIEFSISLPKHPYAVDRGEWLNLAPYSRYELTWLPFGTFELDTTELIGVAHIHVSLTYHYYTGDATLIIGRGNAAGQPFLVLNSNISVQIPTGQIAMNLGNFDNAIKAGVATGAAELASIFGDPVVAVRDFAESARASARGGPNGHSTTTHVPSNGGR